MPLNASRCFVPLLVAMSAPASAQTLLRFRPPVGQTVRYVAIISMDSTGGSMTNRMRAVQTIPMTLRFVSRQRATTLVDSRFGRVKLDVPPGSPMAARKAQIESSLSGQSGTLRVDAEGNAQESVGAVPPRGIGRGFQGIVFSSKAVRTGDAWRSSIDLSQFGSMTGGAGGALSGTIPVVYRLTRLANGVATITMEITGNVTVDVKLKSGTEPMKMAIRYRGTFNVDVQTGLVRNMYATVDNSATLKGGRTMKQRLKSTLQRQ